jgi:hypothetical protein
LDQAAAGEIRRPASAVQARDGERRKPQFIVRTKWGACNVEARRVWLNLELAKKPVQCLEYIVVHEMAHLLERHHNDRFTKLMDSFMPQCPLHRAELNRAPLGHATWKY